MLNICECISIPNKVMDSASIITDAVSNTRKVIWKKGFSTRDKVSPKGLFAIGKGKYKYIYKDTWQQPPQLYSLINSAASLLPTPPEMQ